MSEIKIVTMYAKQDHLNTLFLYRPMYQGTSDSTKPLDVHTYHNRHHRQGVAQLADTYRPSFWLINHSVARVE